MTLRIRAAALAAAALLTAVPAAAQRATELSLMPAELARWDLAAHAGWTGSDQSDVGATWDRWSNAAAAGFTVGRYVTPHLKAETQLTIAREGLVHAQEPLDTPNDPFPPYRPVEHYFQPTTMAAGVSYQFLENQWFHPFAGAGLDLVRERHREVRPPYVFSTRVPGEPFDLRPGPADVTEVTYGARPFVSGGFKWYISPRAFVRTDVRAAWSSRGAARVGWTAGIGVDL